MFRELTPAVRVLLLANCAVFGVMLLLPQLDLDGFALWSLVGDGAPDTPSFEPWQLVTYAFLHEGWLHLLTNMWALYMFGPGCERILGSQRFWIYYFVCVVGAGLVQLVVTGYVRPTPGATIGASGGIFGLLLLFGLARPHDRIMLLVPPIPMPVWVFVTLYGVLELTLGVTGSQQGVAHFAHLGGMAAGYLLILFWRWQRRRTPPRY
ncbi:MAG TPA: rhomboid family intramembrane serine protease [Steroidobacteraceae bacterium]|nr:rhomboid family intramembrane serine protease [Steroidobacteraceae bacterium]